LVHFLHGWIQESFFLISLSPQKFHQVLL
jgi:hypothetical protein